MKITSTERVKRFRARHRWYRPWEHAKRRCTDINHPSYPFYGGRGIHCFLTKEQVKFLYDRDHGETLTLPSLDRIDPDGPYSIENCRFIERKANISRRWDNVKKGK